MPAMRIALLFAVCLAPLTALAKDDGPSQSALIWARDAVAARLDDDPVKAENSVLFYLALRKAKVPAEIHVYERGGHGYGLRKTGHSVAGWPRRCRDWMTGRGFLKTTE